MAGLSDFEYGQLTGILGKVMPNNLGIPLVKSGVGLHEENVNYIYKKSQKRIDGSLQKRIHILWWRLTGPTEATFRYDLFLNRNPNFPILFQTDDFRRAFTQTISQDGPGGILGHQTSPEQYYFQFTQTFLRNLKEDIKRENPGASEEEIQRLFKEAHGRYNSQNERQFINEILNALTKPLPDIYVRALDAVTNGHYSKEQARRATEARGGSRKTRRHRHRR